MDHPKMSGTSAPCTPTRPTIVYKTARTILPSCSSRVTRTRAATQCMLEKWRHASRQQIAQNIRSCSITNQTGATHRFNLYRPRSTLSPTDSPSSVTNSEFKSSRGGQRDSVLSSVLHAFGLRHFEHPLSFSDCLLRGERLEGQRQGTRIGHCRSGLHGGQLCLCLVPEAGVMPATLPRHYLFTQEVCCLSSNDPGGAEIAIQGPCLGSS